MAGAGGIVTYPAYTEIKRAGPGSVLLSAFRGLDSFTFQGIEEALSDLRMTGDLDAFEESVIGHLQEAHTRGVIVGRNWAGDMAPRELDDELFAGRAVEKELVYFEGFMQDLRGGRYGNPEDGFTTGVDARLRMYGNKVGGTMNEVFVLASPDTDTFEWAMLADEHCDDCPRWASGGPYTKQDLPAHPRDGSSQCRTNCRCVLVRGSDGMPGPPPFGLDL